MWKRRGLICSISRFLSQHSPLSIPALSAASHDFTGKKHFREPQELLVILCFAINSYTGKSMFPLKCIQQLDTKLRFIRPASHTKYTSPAAWWIPRQMWAQVSPQKLTSPLFVIKVQNYWGCKWISWLLLKTLTTIILIKFHATCLCACQI